MAHYRGGSSSRAAALRSLDRRQPVSLVTDPTRGRRAQWLLGAVFVALVGAFALGIWGTVIRPAAYEVRGDVVARPAPDLLLVRHEEVTALGMGAMEMMAVSADPALLDGVAVKPGDRVRLAVRRRGDQITLVRIERLR